MGGGNDERPHTDRNNTGTNAKPVAAGIQNAVTCNTCINSAPTDLTAPEETMKLAHSTAPRISETRRPSINENTSPQIIPSSRPFKNIAGTFSSAGSTAKPSNATHDPPMSMRMARAR